MEFDYYYGQESEQFNFVRIPQVFFTDEKFSAMSCEAKILYGLMLNRMGLSKKNGWLDSRNRVFIIYTIEDVMETMSCAKAKAVKTIKELEEIGLIEKNRQGFGKPTLIYVKNFIFKAKDNKEENSVDNMGSKSELHEVSKSNFSMFENQTSLGSKSELDEVSKSNPKKKENISNKDFSKNQSESFDLSENNKMNRISAYENIIKKNILYDDLTIIHPHEKRLIDEMVNIMLDTVLSKGEYVRIHGEDKPRALVSSVLLKLGYNNVEYVLERYKQQERKINKKHAYILSMLYSSAMETDAYYINQVQVDFNIN